VQVKRVIVKAATRITRYQDVHGVDRDRCHVVRGQFGIEHRLVWVAMAVIGKEAERRRPRRGRPTVHSGQQRSHQTEERPGASLPGMLRPGLGTKSFTERDRGRWIGEQLADYLIRLRRRCGDWYPF
jgi:hypothetical protein